ncbi:TPA: VirB4 family type IV secretion/conjugal transfer ATPase [Yersinia enterocolitica]|uniref:VirB4 family type IV secretion/conjugal transfer ATPase n=1 Tax=Yersinia enterocolitica TaxID=630 RepID=UPI0029ACE799|nr:VirB4 family type IV secretion/conjugal transfer ATPase [Yersinia enterocolitica]EKN5104258.1 VirB4 family type IV secretion/conjugal transfer ATPase [Yersinia enterocolitica]EKN6091028.1 VirB4 family type IV secretion/conjugal transfer ATPase [Yersinia enterocolitica]ELX2238786.1 VirB4 family type IV secretion/conjugal transfer ATPase [Yersinia enterocolitica]ELY5241991.1 VirB4 family type IV secretion/conjugal transfer ATPase [Yersinia enterocolitica]
MIEYIPIAYGILGFLLVLILFSLIRAANNEISLKKFRSKDAGVSDLLNYAAVVADGVIVGKNGSFMSAWLYKGDDNASSTDAQRELISFRINQAFAKMGSGWMVHIDAVRRPAPNYSDTGASHFRDPISAAVDEERRQYFESLGTLYEGFFVLTLTWFPPLLAQRKIVELMFDDDSEKHSKTSQTLHLIEQFQTETKNFADRISSSIYLKRLCSEKITNEDGTEVTHDHLLSWLQFCLTGINQPILLPNNPMYIDALIGGQELYAGVVPRIGRKFIQCVAIEGFPLNSYPGILSSLAELPIEYRWSTRFIFLDNFEAVSHLEKFRKKWKQKIHGFFDQLFNTGRGNVNEDALSMVGDASAAIAETNSGMVNQGYYTNNIILMGEDRALVEASARRVEKEIQRLGFASRTETINTMDAFFGSLPGHGVENVRRPLMNTLNVADMVPTSTIWTGENYAPSPLYQPNAPALMSCVTNGSSPFRLNLHVRDLGHGFMFGPTRSGKSTHLSTIAMQFLRYFGSRVYSFDKGMSMYPTCKAVGGNHFTVAANDDKLSFAPLSILKTRNDRAWAMEWIDTILALNNVITTAAQRNEIANAISNMAESNSKTISEFSLLIQDEGIRDALKQYTVDGLMGHLLDAEEDGLTLADFITFEIEDLMNLGEKFALPVLLYLFRRIETSLDGRPTLIILDEAWIMLGHKVFREKIREWLKTLAKLNCSVLMATQNLSDASNSGILDVIVESTATKIYLPNVNAREESAAALYTQMGLNPRQIEIIASAVPKQDYYFVSEKGRRLYNLALGPLALAFVGSTDKESIAAIKELEARYGDAWVHEWLRIKGISLNDYGVAA